MVFLAGKSLGKKYAWCKYTWCKYAKLQQNALLCFGHEFQRRERRPQNSLPSSPEPPLCICYCRTLVVDSNVWLIAMCGWQQCVVDSNFSISCLSSSTFLMASKAQSPRWWCKQCIILGLASPILLTNYQYQSTITYSSQLWVPTNNKYQSAIT